MSKNADTMALGGNRFDCGPKVIKSSITHTTEQYTKLFIKNDDDDGEFIDGFEDTLETISFK